MKKLLLTLILFVLFLSVHAQTTAPGPAEVKLTTALCECISQLDQSKIHNSQEAKQAFMACFEKQADLLPDVAAERSVEMTDDEAMNKIGSDIGVALMKQKCTGFMTLAVKMAGKDSPESENSGSTSGIFKRVDTKGFNYIVISSEGKEKSFLWFEQFSGSEAFMNSAAALVGRKLRVTWQETEAYLPAAKGYYQLKKITGIEILK